MAGAGSTGDSPVGWREPGRESEPAARDPRQSAADGRTGGRQRWNKLGFGNFGLVAVRRRLERKRKRKRGTGGCEAARANCASRFGVGAREATGRDSLMDSASRSKSFFYILFIY